MSLGSTSCTILNSYVFFNGSIGTVYGTHNLGKMQIYIYILLKAETWHLLLLSSCCATSSPRHSPRNYNLLFIHIFFTYIYIYIYMWGRRVQRYSSTYISGLRPKLSMRTCPRTNMRCHRGP